MEISDTTAHTVCERIVSALQSYSEKYHEKFAGVALPLSLANKYPALCPRLWQQLDIIPLVLGHKGRAREEVDQGELSTFSGWDKKELDEQADSMVRKCIRSFGIGHVLQTQIGLGSLVEVDRNFRVRLADVKDYEKTVGSRTWSIAQYYAQDLKRRGVKIAFFSMTSHGRPDIHTRHTLVRLLHCLEINVEWYVPKPRPGIYHIIRKIQDALEGLGDPNEHLTIDEELRILEWVYENARRYWLSEGGPLQARRNGGADVVVIDDAPLAPAALLSKQADPERPVIFENRIQFEHGLPGDSTSLSARAWNFLRTRLNHVDLVVSQVPKVLAPDIMPGKKVGYIPVTVDQLDGFNKNMRESDIAFYGREFNSLCRTLETPTIKYPEEEYILHLSQFRSLEETITVLNAYQRFCNQYTNALVDPPLPKLLIYHYGPCRSSKSTLIYDALLSHVEINMPELASSICVMQIGPPDQLWNALLTNAKIVMEFSLSEGIPPMLLAAVQKGKPIITVKEMGFFSFTENVDNILFVEKGDENTTALLLFDLWTDPGLADQIVLGEPRKLRDELTTVGNAVSWLFLAAEMSSIGGSMEPDGGDIFELAGRGAGL
ncbi:hypothetical protein BBP40_005645 [Aspergillus hancockii]|nr:hypothetical protein BBP40_005645 [Aspergillus hancockii]